jgi:shikimate kinase
VSEGPFGVVLIGFMGAGKSVVGRAVSRLTGSQFLDLDAMIEAEAGMPVSEIFRTLGEPGFREIERRLVLQAVSVPGRVVATGGGAFVDEGSRQLLKAYAPVVHLDVAPETVIARVGKDERRPLLQGEDREGKVRDLMAQRRTAYEEADITISTDRKSVPEIAALVVARVASSRGGAK